MIVAVLLGVVGAAIGGWFVLRAGSGSGSSADSDTMQGTLRVRAEVHTGVEQALVGIVRYLSLAGKPEDAVYGQMYVQQSGEGTLTVGSRSEIGRGFRAMIMVKRGRSVTHVDYSILRLPGDDSLHRAVLQFELLLIEALRRVDPNADVRLVGRALRDLDRTPTAREGE